MAEISQINLNGTTFDVADASARTQGATNATNITRMSSQISGKQDAFTFNPDDFSFDDATNTVSLKGGATLVIDNALSATSTNPVQNRVVTVNLQAKQDILANSNDITVNADGTLSIRRDNLIDSALSTTSTNAIANNAVNTAITGVNTAITTVNSAVATLNGDSETAGSVDYKIAQALQSASGLSVVTALPAVGDEKIIYVLKGARNKMYVWADNAYLPVSDYDAAIAQLQATIGDSTSGLVKDIADLTSDVSDNADAIDALETTVGDASSGLVKDVATNTSAISTINGTDTGSSMRDVAEDVVSTIPKAITPKGTIEFADLPALADSEIGDMYNIEDAFTTTADFIMGAGTSMQANSNVYVIDAGSGTKKWDVFATGGIADMSAYQTKALTSHTGITATTVETALEEVASGVADNASDISDLQTTVGDNTSGLVKAVADNVAALAKLDKAALSVLTLPTASAELENMVRFNVADEKWYLCLEDAEASGTYLWKDLTPAIPTPDLSKYSKNLIIDKASDITVDQIAEYDTFDTTDNECGMVFGEVAEGDHNAVDGDSVYKAIANANAKSPIVTRYYGSQTVSVTTFNHLTIVCASRFPTCAGAWLILNNYSSNPACIELGKASNSSMSVTASVDTTDTSYAKTNIAVTVGSSSYEWDIVQIPF